MTIFYILCYQITESGMKPHVKLAVNLVFTDGQCNLPDGFVWVNMYSPVTKQIVLGAPLLASSEPLNNPNKE